jgi:hypothetical protein
LWRSALYPRARSPWLRAPAYAAWNQIAQSSASQGSNTGTATLYKNDDGTTHMAGQGAVTKAFQNDGTDRYACAELWVDYQTNLHRPPDVYVDCGGSGTLSFSSGVEALHHPASGGPPLSWSEVLSDMGAPWIQGVNVCRVDARASAFARVAGGNCSSGTGVDLTAYNGRTYADLANLNNLDEPEFLEGRIDHVNSSQELAAENSAISTNGWYHAVMQSDGNFVIYNVLTSHACWSSGTANHHNSKLVMGGDGNLYVWDLVANHASWMTGTFPNHNTSLVMGNDGNLFIWDNVSNGAIWMTGTWGC